MTEHPEMPLLVCGDFNDIPQSYTHYRIQHPQRLDTEGAADIAPLTDCYQEAATGPGYTIYQNAMRVRIDNILCSQQFTPIHTMTDRSVRMSDHFPVIALLEIYR
jgi:endonuclease/exonuclease/phosphatase family metal-dependent hydrolase